MEQKKGPINLISLFVCIKDTSKGRKSQSADYEAHRRRFSYAGMPDEQQRLFPDRTFPFVLIKDDLTHTHVFRGNLYIFIFLDILE